uniref:C-C motif chemokine n=1 Tax=Denticeps clupeoides TaxID=299321 RepID=A0AAY4D7S1_9TELE
IIKYAYCLFCANPKEGYMYLNGSQPEECCFKFFPKKIPLNRVKSYVSTRPECSKDGVVFITQKNNRICADPGISWVKWIISKLDERDIA